MDGLIWIAPLTFALWSAAGAAGAVLIGRAVRLAEHREFAAGRAR